MKASELRLGNLVEYKNQYINVSGIGPFGIQSEGKEYLIIAKFSTPDIQPIPLTEEWVLKFGFKKYVSDDIDMDIDFQISFHKKSSEGLIVQLFMDSNGVIFFNHSGISLYSIHHLQNLYFALTGEELILNA
jgi:hypothetical protein